MIESIEIWGIRGIRGTGGQDSRKVEFGQHTIIIGANGAGKTALMCGLHFVCMGKVAGAKPSEMWLNANNPEQIRARAKINGRLIERRLTNGKTLSESIVIDGVTQKLAKGAADAVLMAAFGRDPLIVDIPEIQRATSSVRRRMILGMVCDLERLESATMAEEKARQRANDARSHRQQCDKTVATLTQQLSEMERPVGNLATLKNDRGTLAADLKAAQKRIADGDANDRIRKTRQASQEAVPALRERVEAAEGSLNALMADFGATEARMKALEAPKRPAGRSKGLDEDIAEELTLCVALLDKYIQIQGTGWVGAEADLVKAPADAIRGMLPNKKAQAAYAKARKEYDQKVAELSSALADMQAKIDRATQERDLLRAELAHEEKVLATAEVNSPPATDQDRAMAAGLEAKLAEIGSKIDALAKCEAIEEAIEKANIEAEKAIEAHTEAQDNLSTAQSAMAALITEAAERLCLRSEEVLASGKMAMRDDGKDLEILWAREDGVSIPWVTLSGGEKAIFDVAVGHCLAPRAMVIIEGAEVDDNNLLALVKKLNGSALQVCLLTCHEPVGLDGSVTGTDWKVIRL